jgi:hypothetical protein
MVTRLPSLAVYSPHAPNAADRRNIIWQLLLIVKALSANPGQREAMRTLLTAHDNYFAHQVLHLCPEYLDNVAALYAGFGNFD